MTDLPKIGKLATRALVAKGINTLEQVAERSEVELLQLHGFGARAIKILKPALAEHGLDFESETSTE